MIRYSIDELSLRSVFESIIINEQTGNLRYIEKHGENGDQDTIRIKSDGSPPIKDFYHVNKHRSRNDFMQSAKMNGTMKIYLVLLMRLYDDGNERFSIFTYTLVDCRIKSVFQLKFLFHLISRIDRIVTK